MSRVLCKKALQALISNVQALVHVVWTQEPQDQYSKLPAIRTHAFRQILPSGLRRTRMKRADCLSKWYWYGDPYHVLDSGHAEHPRCKPSNLSTTSGGMNYSQTLCITCVAHYDFSVHASSACTCMFVLQQPYGHLDLAT